VSVDAISGLVGLTAVGVLGVAALGLFGRRVPRFSQVVAIVLIVYFIAVADLLSIAQQVSLAAANLVAGLIIAGLLIVTASGPNRTTDDQGRDNWGR
jgi:hypothetical protein